MDVVIYDSDDLKDVYNKALDDLLTNVTYNYAREISIKELQEEIELLKSKTKINFNEVYNNAK